MMTTLLRPRSQVPAAIAAIALMAACARSPSTAHGLEAHTMQSGGLTRTFLAYTPAERGRPLVIALHGHGGDGAGQAALSGLLAIGQRERFTLVLPDGVERGWHDAREVGVVAERGVDDLGFLRAIITEHVARGADASRVFITGMSNGGFMALTAACTMADVVRAVASVAGGMAPALVANCAPSRPVAVLTVMGDADPVVPFEGGLVGHGRRGETAGARAVIERFAELDGCQGTPERTTLPDLDAADGTRVERARFSGCRAPVESLVIHGGGHAWPAGTRARAESATGRVSHDVNASEALWAFFDAASR
jgi:polyhydroxybutyrate depolymerase